MHHARAFPLSVTRVASCDAARASFWRSRAFCSTVCGAPREALRRFLVPRFSPAFEGWPKGKTVTSSNCELAAQSDVGSSSLSPGSCFRISLRECEQHGPKPPSKGPTHLLRSAACFWQAPSPGERCAWAPLLRKPRAPSVVGAGALKAWKAFNTFSTSTGDLRSLAAPRREALSRKSGCLGRAVSLTPRRRNLLRRPTGPLRTPLVLEHCPENAAPFLPPALPGVDAPSGGQMARSRPTHRMSVGSDVGAAPGNDLYVSMQPAD